MDKLIAILIVGAVIVGLVFYLGQQKGTLPAALPNAQKQNQAVANPPSRSLEVTLTQQNKSGISGKAMLTETGGKLMVAVTVQGAANGVSQPAHIHLGRCPGVGEIKYPLTNLVNGKSETTLPTTLDMLKAQLPLSLNVHKSDKEANVYVSCGTLFEE